LGQQVPTAFEPGQSKESSPFSSGEG